MPDEVKKCGETCAFWSACEEESPWACENAREAGKPGYCKPWKIPCELDEGRVCGMYLQK